MTEQDLIDKGYTESPINFVFGKCADKFYQKAMRSLAGTRTFFISIFVYLPNERIDYLGFQPESQFKTNHGTSFNITMLPNADTTIEDIEKFFGNIYTNMKCTPYDN